MSVRRARWIAAGVCGVMMSAGTFARQGSNAQAIAPAAPPTAPANETAATDAALHGYWRGQL